MQKIRKKIQTYSVCEILYGVLLLLLVVSVLPLLQTGLYAHPTADDFTYGQRAHQAWEETGSLLAVIAAAVETARAFWYGYQGPFASAFFMALHPAVISERLYPLTTVIMLGSMIISTGVLVYVVLGKYLGIERRYRRIVVCVLLLWCTQLLATPFEAFYWFCGAVHYVFMHGCMLLLLSVLLLAYKANGRWSFFLIGLSIPLAVCCGGANFSTALLSAVLMCLLLVVWIGLRKKRELLISLPAVMVTAGAFILNVCAPGNSVRQLDQMSSLPPFQAIYYAFRYGFQYVGEWTNVYVGLGLLLLIPIVWKGMERNQYTFSWRFPWLVTGLSFCLVSAMFAPSTYAMGLLELYGRTKNAIQMTFYMLLVLNLVYWIGWIQQNLQRISEARYDALLQGLAVLCKKHAAAFLAGVGVALVFAVVCEDRVELASKAAVHELKEGYVQNYHEEVLHRIALLSAEGVEEVWVPNYTVMPSLLINEHMELQEDWEDWRNASVAEWYGKERVNFSKIY